MRKLENIVEGILIYMSLGSYQSRGAGSKSLKLHYFSGAEVLEETDAETTAGRCYLNPTVNNLDYRVVPKWDVSALTLPDRLTSDWSYQVTRFRKVPVSAVRGLPFVSPITGEMSTAWFRENGTYDAQQEYLAYQGNRWLTLGGANCRREFRGRAYHNAEWCAAAKLSLSIQFSREYYWMVELGYEDCPTVSFATDPTGVREVFRLRDIPEGKGRRAALRNWVREHWRKKRDARQDLTYVREHLRGAEQFSWNGMYCRIRPSSDDLRRNTPGVKQCADQT